MVTKYFGWRTRTCNIYKNNTSPRKFSKFVDDSIQEMLKAGTIRKSNAVPKKVNPLSVSKKGKMRLILICQWTFIQNKI